MECNLVYLVILLPLWAAISMNSCNCHVMSCTCTGIIHVLFKREENGVFSYIGHPRNGNGIMSLGMMKESELHNLRYLRISKRHMKTEGLVETVPTQNDSNDGKKKNMLSINTVYGFCLQTQCLVSYVHWYFGV